MTETGKKALLGAAVAGIIGAALVPSSASAKGKTADDNVPCWGVNKCAGHAHSCTGKGSCAGKNTCKGQGWLPMPKDSCDNIKDTPPKAHLQKTEKADAQPQPLQNFGSH